MPQSSVGCALSLSLHPEGRRCRSDKIRKHWTGSAGGFGLLLCRPRALVHHLYALPMELDFGNSKPRRSRRAAIMRGIHKGILFLLDAECDSECTSPTESAKDGRFSYSRRTSSSAVHLLLARELDGECLFFALARRGALTAWCPDDWSFRTTLSSDLLTLMRPLYSMKPSLRKRFMKKLTRDRVVPIISASVSWVIFGINASGSPALPNSAINKRILASRFSLELNS